MGYVSVMGSCYACKNMFSFHPHFVPSLTIRGTREPFCRSCIEQANVTRAKNGMAPLTIHPLAYEACEESEL